MSVSLMQRLRGDGFLAYCALIAHPLRKLEQVLIEQLRRLPSEAP